MLSTKKTAELKLLLLSCLFGGRDYYRKVCKSLNIKGTKMMQDWLIIYLCGNKYCFLRAFPGPLLAVSRIR